jgi:hypothetical protein
MLPNRPGFVVVFLLTPPVPPARLMDMNRRRRLSLHRLPEDLENPATVRRREISHECYERTYRQTALPEFGR